VPPSARRLFTAIALAVTLGAAGGLAFPGGAIATTRDAPVAVAPEEGAFVEPGTVVLAWSPVDALAGYEVTWATDGGAEAGAITTTQTSIAIEVGAGSYSWQVRALPDGDWSAPATFFADVELPTLPLPEQPAVAPARPGLDAVPGSVWIGGALGFSVVFLVIVVVQSRIHRERDA
jgi:hypothetical protein